MCVLGLCARLLLTAAPDTRADWPMFRANPARTAYVSGYGGVPAGPPRWVDTLGAAIVSSPSITGGVAYVGARDSCVYAIDIESGDILWRRPTSGWVDASALVHEGRVFIGSRDRGIYALDRDSGGVAARVEAALQLSSVGVDAEGTLLTGLGPPLNGFVTLRYLPVGSGILEPGWTVRFDQMSYSSPAVCGTIAVIGASSGALHAFDLRTRSRLWKLETGGEIYLSTPAIADSVVYFAPGNFDRHVYAVSLEDGTIRWKSTGEEGGLARRAMRRSITTREFMDLLRLSPAHRSLALERLERQGVAVPSVLKESGLKKPRAASAGFFPFGDMKTSSVAVGPDNVYVVQKELGHPAPRFTLRALDKESGKQQWKHAEMRRCVKLGYCSSPVVTDKAVIFGWGEGRAYALDRANGRLLWQDSLRGDIVSSPALADSTLLFATMDGMLYAYKAGYNRANSLRILYA